MQYPYSSNGNIVENSRSNTKSPNPENQMRTFKEDKTDIGSKSVRTRETVKSDENSSNEAFPLSSIQITQNQPSTCKINHVLLIITKKNCYLNYKISHIYLKQTIGVGSNNGNVNHRQGDYTDIGSKATSHIPYQPMKNAASNKKMILEDQHSTRYDDASKMLGNVPKICQSGISSNLNNGIVGDNTKSENQLTTFGNSNNRLHKGTNMVYKGKWDSNVLIIVFFGI